MRFSATDADNQAIKIIQILIEHDYYKGYRKEDLIRTIGKDANALSYMLTKEGEGDVGHLDIELHHTDDSADKSEPRL